mmetsp:Transcript_9874/g.22984  ORF Transcript_9874/g.22984 Transcript_9874/m.22984 type:complete len:207 (+) Transcript_9874:110-730(+)
MVRRSSCASSSRRSAPSAGVTTRPSPSWPSQSKESRGASKRSLSEARSPTCSLFGFSWTCRRRLSANSSRDAPAGAVLGFVGKTGIGKGSDFVLLGPRDLGVAKGTGGCRVFSSCSFCCSRVCFTLAAAQVLSRLPPPIGECSNSSFAEEAKACHSFRSSACVTRSPRAAASSLRLKKYRQKAIGQEASISAAASAAAIPCKLRCK